MLERSWVLDCAAEGLTEPLRRGFVSPILQQRTRATHYSGDGRTGTSISGNGGVRLLARLIRATIAGGASRVGCPGNFTPRC